ncbi:hypothetical protein [Paracoccus marcusii]|uniref:hypothetical protein n=1 Tax=Paracoccus marcusii TaxID=59779 RepID=UPI0035A7274C
MAHGANKIHHFNLHDINRDLNSFSRVNRPTPEAVKAIESMRELQKHLREVNLRIRKLNDKVSDDV